MCAEGRRYPRFRIVYRLDARNYGVLSPRDVVRHFSLRTTGSHQFGPSGQPIAIPEFELVPR